MPLQPRLFFRLALVIAGFGATFASASSLPATSPATVDWAAFLATQDMVWKNPPAAWEEGVILGNGNLGANIYMQDGALAWEINRADVYHGTGGGAQRYRMGQLVLRTAGQIQGGDARLNLWNAEARGTLRTTRGEVRWRSFTSTEPAVVVLEVEGTGGEASVEAVWKPAPPLPPSEVHRKQVIPDALQHPAPVEGREGDLAFSTQQFKAGGAFAVAVQAGQLAGNRRIYYVVVGSAPAPKAAGDNPASRALDEARTVTRQAAAAGVDALAEGHRRWWHAYYPASFVSFPDARLQAFYWAQVYKLGAAMRADGPVLDLMGPWFRGTPWPRIWWNLNVQLTYAPLTAANRLDIAESLYGSLDRHREQLHRNAPEAIRADAAVIGRSSGPDLTRAVNLGTGKGGADLEAGNLPWIMFLYYQFYRGQMDDAVLTGRVLPLLKPAIGHYLAYVRKDDKGVYHLPVTHSPEFADVADANYDLGFLRWGLQTLIAEHERLKLDAPQLARWREVLANLAPFPTDATGLMVGAGRALDSSHRHYSHLVSIYPLHLLTADRPADRALIERSLGHWFSMPEKHKGYSNTGAASMHALLGNGNAAVEQLNILLDTWIHPNTLYTESGPVIETPLSAMCAVHELFLQDWGGRLRVFGAVPVVWSEASFADLRADGAFLVSGRRHKGKNLWVKIQSLAGQPCRVSVAGWQKAVVREYAGTDVPPRITVLPDGGFSLDLPKGATVLLAADADGPLPPLVPVTDRHFYGGK
jgi:alpha-L-fucosidase 2